MNNLQIMAILLIIIGILIIAFPALVAWIIGVVLILSGFGNLIYGENMYKMK